MSDGCFGLSMFFTCVALIGVLWHRYQARKAARRLRQLLKDAGIDVNKLDAE